MRHLASKHLFSYWTNLRNDRKAPTRAEIEPSDIREYLGDTFILEVNQSLRTISFRLAGTRLCNAYGQELKGLGFMNLWAEEDNLRVLRAITRTYRDFKPAILSHKGSAADGREVDFETLVLPLLPTHDGDIRLLGISTTKETPIWLGNDPIVTNKVTSAYNLTGVTRDDTNEASLVPFPGNFKISPSVISATIEGRQFGHLRVLDGGKQG